MLLEEWDGITANDLQQHYGIDADLPETMQRPWWWLRSRMLGLLDVPESRLVRRVAAREEETRKQTSREPGEASG